jgi:hypothetical protein
MTQGNQFAKEGWDSLFNVIATSNTLLNNLETKVGANVTPAIIERVKGEAYFMRATAYFYLVRTWGAVPILNRIEQYTNNEPIFKNRVEDVYTFIINDLKAASLRLPLTTGTNKLEAGRLTKTVPDGMLAKVYITLKDYPNAKLYAEKVINSGNFSLLNDYGNLFNNPDYNINNETLFALHWVACSGWGVQNTNQAYMAAAPKLTGTGDGWATFQPTIDLQNAYESNDKRRKATIMLPGDIYPELVTKEDGYTVPATGLTPTIAGFRKYVVGSQAEHSNVCFMSTDENTSILRYADILLIHAEAILAGSGTTSDVVALKSFNEVRARAGLSPKTALTADIIFKERRIEFVGEGDYWFDLLRRNRTDAIAIISNQERGIYTNRTTLEVASKKIVPSESDFLLPIPNSDSDLNPNLLKDPVPFQF